MKVTDLQGRIALAILVVAVMTTVGMLWVDDARNLWNFMGFMGWLLSGTMAWILFTGVCCKTMWKHEKLTIFVLGAITLFYWALVIRALVVLL